MKRAIFFAILLLVAVSARAALACIAPAAGIEVERTAERIWKVCATSPAGPVRWVLDGQHTTSPPDPRAEGPGGDGVRLRELWWTDAAGVERQLLSCANCDLIEAVRLPGSPAWAWTGPGYGMGRPRAPLVLLDGELAELPLWEPRAAAELALHQVVESYAPAEAVAPGSARLVALARETTIMVTAEGLRFAAEIEALADHERWTVYHGRAEALTPCHGGLFDGYQTALGDAWSLPDCEPAEANLYTYPPSQHWLELTSSVAPVRLRLTSDQAQPWVVIWNRALDGKLKPYGRPATGIELLVKGSIRSYHHSIEVRGP